jgi:hypothetical protein
MTRPRAALAALLAAVGGVYAFTPTAPQSEPPPPRLAPARAPTAAEVEEVVRLVRGFGGSVDRPHQSWVA